MDKIIGSADLATVALLAGAVVGVVMVGVTLIRSFLHVCPPNKVLIFSGRSRTAEDGRKVGFRIVYGGRGFRTPFVEQAEYMDVSLISVPMSVTGAYSEGGIPLSVHAIANVKISTDRRFCGNAIERFLGRDRAEIGRVAKETLEGHLRGVLATMTPEEVNEDRLTFAAKLLEEAEADLQKLGLHLDTLKIQHVADDRNYLESIGREQIARIIREAEVAESNAERSAREAEEAARSRGEVAHTEASAAIKQKENELRQIKAELYAEARSEEEKAVAAASAARAEAEKELQQVRSELEQLRLEADVTIPAEVEREVREALAAGEAASIAENGKAMARALEAVATAWRDTRGQAMDIYVLQNLEQIFGTVATAARNLKIREVNLVDGGDGKTLPAYIASYPATVGRLLEEVSETLGVDVIRAITGVSGNGVAAVAPTSSSPTPSQS